MKKSIQVGSSISNSNFLIALAVFLLCLAGLIALYSASMHVDAPFFKKVIGKQLLWMILGLITIVAVFLIQKKILFNGAFIFYWIGIAFIILPYFLRSSVAGTNRWFVLGPFHFQPSEFMKILVIIAVARYLSKSELIISDFKSLIMPLFLALLPM